MVQKLIIIETKDNKYYINAVSSIRANRMLHRIHKNSNSHIQYNQILLYDLAMASLSHSNGFLLNLVHMPMP